MKQHCAVLLVANYSNDTGYAWSNIYRLFNSIARNFRDRNVATFISFEHISGEIKIFDDDIPFKSFEFTPYNITFRSLALLRRAVIKDNIKFVYFTDMPTWHWLYALLRIWGVKTIVVHCRVSVPDPDPVTPEKGVRRILKSIPNSIPLIRSDYVYAISEFVRHRVINKNCYPGDRVVKILNGIDLDRFLCAEPIENKDKIIIFCCARARIHKGIPTLIKAVGLLKHQHNFNNFILEYAGSGPDLGYFKSMSKELGLDDVIVFHGHLDTTHEHACCSDIIVVPSEWGEGFGSTVAEAMAAGKALVATCVGGIPEVVGSEECGVLIPPGNSEEMATTLARLMLDVGARKRLGLNAQDRAKQKFGEEQYHLRVVNRIMRDFGFESG